jgi:hypothetical protein
MTEHIRGVTWDLAGQRLYPFQMAQYLFKAIPTNGKAAPFQNARVLLEMVATMYAEASGYLRAFHLNVVRNDDGTIFRDSEGRLVAKSADLGWIQKNVDFPDTPLHDDEVQAFIDGLFDAETTDWTDRPGVAATVAATIYTTPWTDGKPRGFRAWFGHLNWEKQKSAAALAVANFLAVEVGLGQSYFTIRSR